MKSFYCKVRIVLSCMLLSSLPSCSVLDETIIEGSPMVDESVPKISLEQVVYHRGSETYMVPQNDPYTLENFQEAYNRLVRNVSSQAISVRKSWNS